MLAVSIVFLVGLCIKWLTRLMGSFVCVALAAGLVSFGRDCTAFCPGLQMNVSYPFHDFCHGILTFPGLSCLNYWGFYSVPSLLSLNFQKPSPFNFGLWKCAWPVILIRVIFPANKLLPAVPIDLNWDLVLKNENLPYWDLRLLRINFSNHFWSKLTRDGTCGFWWTKIVKRIEQICNFFFFFFGRKSCGDVFLSFWLLKTFLAPVTMGRVP